MANTYYDSELTAEEIEAALKAVDGLIVPANNGKVIAVDNGTLVAKSVSEYIDLNLQSKTVTPSANQQIVSPDSGYNGLSDVTINGDTDLVAGNIKNGVNIFGVTGSYEGSAVIYGGNTPDYEMDGTGLICTLDGHSFTKVYSGKAFVAYYYDGTYTCPVLISTVQSAVVYNTIGRNFEARGTITYNGVLYYYSGSSYGMEGNFDSTAGFAKKLSGTFSLVQAAEFLAEEVYKTIITSNGSYPVPSGYDGYGDITVDVQPSLQSKTVTQNGVVTADTGYDGLASVNVNVSGGSSSDTFSASAPSSTSGRSEGDFHYQRFGAKLAYDRRNTSWLNATSTFSTGNKFRVSEIVTVVGIWAYLRNANVDVYLSKTDGTELAHIHKSDASYLAKNIFYFDTPITLEANTEYIVWYSNSGPGSYINSGSFTPTDSRFTHIIGMYASGQNNFPSNTIAQNLYPTDVLAIDSTIDEFIARQWKLKNGVWTPVSTITP